MKTTGELKKYLAREIKVINACKEGYLIKLQDENGKYVEYAIHYNILLGIYVKDDATLYMQYPTSQLSATDLKVLRSVASDIKKKGDKLTSNYIFIKEKGE